ncbi:hypothetical protein [Teichococcus aestuarii]|uniref:hypothetical protein n=1 Tax=Teichococcus aestuarii TaxID=568898 RepID=UPI0036085B09
MGAPGRARLRVGRCERAREDPGGDGRRRGRWAGAGGAHRAAAGGGALYDLSGKFGAGLEEAVALLRAARPHAARLGISFHVGSQCMDPLAYRRAIALAGRRSAWPGWRSRWSMSAAASP